MHQRSTNSKRKLGSDENESEVAAQKRVKIDERSSSSPFKEAFLSPSHQAVSNGWEDGSSEWPPPIQYSEAESEAEDLTVKEERKEINTKKPQKENKQLSCKVKQPKKNRRRAGFSSGMLFLGIDCSQSKPDVLKSIEPDPNAAVPMKPKIHYKTASLWSNILKSGLPADSLANLLKLYPGLANCNVAPPKLNPEVVVQLDQAQVTRDAYLCSKQEKAGASITALGQAICMLTSTPRELWNQEQLVKWLGDAARLTASLHYEESLARRTMVTPLFPEEFRAVCEVSKSDDFLFGENLGGRVQEFKRIVDSLKPPPKSSHGKHQPQQNQQQSQQKLPRNRRRRTKRFHSEMPRSSPRETEQKKQESKQESSRNSK